MFPTRRRANYCLPKASSPTSVSKPAFCIPAMEHSSLSGRSPLIPPDTFDPLASKGIPSVLEMEVSVEWPTESSRQRPEVDHRDGNAQSDLGRGTHRQ